MPVKQGMLMTTPYWVERLHQEIHKFVSLTMHMGYRCVANLGSSVMCGTLPCCVTRDRRKVQRQGQRPPVAAHSLCEEHGHELLDVLAAGVQGVDDRHARVVAGPQRPVSGHPRARLCPPACPAEGCISRGTHNHCQGLIFERCGHGCSLLKP